MKRYHSLYYCIVFFLYPFWLPAQEQMTFYDGDPCCYYIDQILQNGADNFLIARDDQLSVEIYELLEGNAELLYSTHQSDKTYLLDQGRRPDLYYWIYTDRVEVYSFRKKELLTYEMPVELPLQEYFNVSNAFHFMEQGVVISPPDLSGTLQLFEFATGDIDTLNTTIDQNTYVLPLDSHLYFTNTQNGNAAVLAHNVITDELVKVYTSSSASMNIFQQGGFLYFMDDNGLHISSGTVESTKTIDPLEPACDRQKIFANDTSIYLLCSRDEVTLYAQYNARGVLQDSFHFRPGTGLISSFLPSVNGDIIYRDLYSNLFHYDSSRDSVVEFNKVGWEQYQLYGSLLYYYKLSTLYTYDLSSNKMDSIGRTIGVDQPFGLTVEQDSFFYFGFRNEDLRMEVNVFEKGESSQRRILIFGNDSEGMPFRWVQKVGRHLFIPWSQKVLKNDQFEDIEEIQFGSSIKEYKGRPFILGKDKTLYEYSDNHTLISIIEDAPVFATNSFLYVINGDLYTRYYSDTSSARHLVKLDVETGSFMELLPPDTVSFEYCDYRNEWSNDRFIIYEVQKFGEQLELWRYDTRNGNWLKLLDDVEWVNSSSPQASVILKEHLYAFPVINEKVMLFSIDLVNGSSDLITDFNLNATDGIARVVDSCDSEIIIYAFSQEESVSSIWVSDGTLEGTKMIEHSEKGNPYFIAYRFGDDIYFTESDSFFTHSYRYACGSGEAEQVDWYPYFITQGLYKLGDNTYSIFNHRYPRQNLSVGELFNDQFTIIKEAPFTIGFSGDEFFGDINRPVNTYEIGDSILAIVAPFDLKGEEIWFLYSDGRMERKTDLNEGRFDSEISGMLEHDGYLYFNGYKYGPGHQIWRIPITNSSTPTVDANELNEHRLAVYPNPVLDQAWMHSIADQKGRITIFDLNGKPMARIVKTRHQESTPLPINKLPPGTYFVQFKAENGMSLSSRFVKISN